jgi:hypothetical protein
MKYTLEDIWNQSLEDSYSAKLDADGYESRMVYGIKIVRDTESGEIEIFNTMKGGDYYQPINPQEMEVFNNNGWRYGVFVVSLSNYRTKLNAIQERIKREVNGSNSAKKLEEYKLYRESILSRYTEVNQKLNQLIKSR